MSHFDIQSQIDLDALLDTLKKKGLDIYFIQIGAFDGVTNDHLYERVRTYSLSGALVEPQIAPFCALRRNYRDVAHRLKFINAAIATHDGQAPLYVVNEDSVGPTWLPQIASLKRDVVLSHQGEVPEIGRAHV